MQSSNESNSVSIQSTRILLIENVAAMAEVVGAYLAAAPGAVVVEAVDSLRAALAVC